MKVKGTNVVVYFTSVPTTTTTITTNIVNNGDGTQTVTFTWDNEPDNTVAITLSYNDGSWHNYTGGTTSPRDIIIPVGTYTYRLTYHLADLSSVVYAAPNTFQSRVTYGCALSVTLNLVTDFIETSVSGTGNFATFLPTKNSFTGTLDGLTSLEEPNMLSLADLRSKQINQELLTMEYELTDEGGNVYTEAASFYISSSSFTGSFDDMSHFSVELRGTGVLIPSGES